jgi:hypothetical protein
MGLFSQNPLEKIERKDEKQTNHLERFVRGLNESFQEFRRILHVQDIEKKEEALDELREKLETALREVLILREDEQAIERVESTQQRYAIPQDDQLLEDKREQLEKIKQTITVLIDIIDENPNLAEYTTELNAVVVQDLAEAETAFMHILEDDKKLSQMYKQLH